jgi:hypothetical protein
MLMSREHVLGEFCADRELDFYPGGLVLVVRLDRGLHVRYLLGSSDLVSVDRMPELQGGELGGD